MAMRQSVSFLFFALAACASPPGSAPAAATAGETAMTPSIAGTKWYVPIQGEAADRPRLEFMADGRLGGYSGCNSVSGTWRMEGGAVHLGPLIMTKRACPGERDEMERRFLQAVNAQARFSIEGGRLIAEAPGGRLELTRDAGT